MLNLCKVGKCAEIRHFEEHEGIFPKSLSSEILRLSSKKGFTAALADRPL